MTPSVDHGPGSEPPEHVWAVPGRPTRIVVDLDRIGGNLGYFRRTVTPGTAVMAVVKADGYGHGAVMVARAAVEAGAAQLAVATVDEGVVLRRHAVSVPILVLGPVDPLEVPRAAQNDLTLTLVDPQFVSVVAAAARTRRRREAWPVHVKIDSGMHRFGVDTRDALALFQRLDNHPELQVAGTFTHFADADGVYDAFTREQAERFLSAVGDVRREGFGTGLIHLSNSAAALRWRRLDHDMVRVGIALYGLSPGPDLLPADPIRPALSVWSRIARVTSLSEGDSVSYGRTYRAAGPESVGLVPIGYADGYARALSGIGTMRVQGQEAIVRGRVSMDQTVINLSPELGVQVGCQVEVISAGVSNPNSVARLAQNLGTIDYEIVTSLSQRIPRIYVKGRRVVAIQDLHGVSPVDEP